MISMNAVLHNFWQWLNAWDTALFLQLNTVLTNPVFDLILPYWRNANTWVPLYLFLIVFSVLNFRRKALFWILGAIVTVVLTDQISSSVFKPFFERPRPCNEPLLISHVRLLLDHCSGGFSFTSSHAANHFGLAMFIVMTLQPLLKSYRYLFLIWAAIISYAQVYVGVHFPLDVFAGAIIGIAVGYLNSKLYYKIACIQ
jgi:undecaprenyl-diphosphatase